MYTAMIKRTISVTCWKTLIMRLLEKLQVDFVLSQIFLMPQIFVLTDRRYSTIFLLVNRGEFHSEQETTTTILIMEAHKAREQIIPQIKPEI